MEENTTQGRKLTAEEYMVRVNAYKEYDESNEVSMSMRHLKKMLEGFASQFHQKQREPDGYILQMGTDDEFNAYKEDKDIWETRDGKAFWFSPPPVIEVSNADILLQSSDKDVYVNDEQRIGYQKGAKWLRLLLTGK